MQKMTDPPLAEDPETGVPLERVFHPIAVHFKGKGFYNTDYGTKKRAREKAAESESSAKKDTKSGDVEDRDEVRDDEDRGEGRNVDDVLREPEEVAAGPTGALGALSYRVKFLRLPADEPLHGGERAHLAAPASRARRSRVLDHRVRGAGELDLVGRPSADTLEKLMTNVVFLGAAALCAWRAVEVRAERAAWACFAMRSRCGAWATSTSPPSSGTCAGPDPVAGRRGATSRCTRACAGLVLSTAHMAAAAAHPVGRRRDRRARDGGARRHAPLRPLEWTRSTAAGRGPDGPRVSARRPVPPRGARAAVAMTGWRLAARGPDRGRLRRLRPERRAVPLHERGRDVRQRLVLRRRLADRRAHDRAMRRGFPRRRQRRREEHGLVHARDRPLAFAAVCLALLVYDHFFRVQPPVARARDDRARRGARPARARRSAAASACSTRAAARR